MLVKCTKHSTRCILQLTPNLLILVLAILNTRHENGSLVREDQALPIFTQVPVAGPQDGIQHALVQQEVPHPLGDDDVDFGKRQLDFFHLALKKRNLVAHTVGGDDFLGLDDDGGHIDADDMFGACLYGEPVNKIQVSIALFFGVCCDCV